MSARCPAIILLILAYAHSAHAARVLSHYDVKSLCGMARLIVKAEIIDATDVQTPDGDCAVWNVKILSCIEGNASPQSVIRVAGIEEYKKGPGTAGVDEGFPRLAKGDTVYLFLVPKDARIGYAKYALTNADWKVIESGARLTMNEKVFDFGQYFPPAPSAGPVPGFVAVTEKTFPETTPLSVKEFEKQLQAALEGVRKAAEAPGATTRP